MNAQHVPLQVVVARSIALQAIKAAEQAVDRMIDPAALGGAAQVAWAVFAAMEPYLQVQPEEKPIEPVPAKEAVAEERPVRFREFL